MARYPVNFEIPSKARNTRNTRKVSWVLLPRNVQEYPGKSSFLATPGYRCFPCQNDMRYPGIFLTQDFFLDIPGFCWYSWVLTNFQKKISFFEVEKSKFFQSPKNEKQSKWKVEKFFFCKISRHLDEFGETVGGAWRDDTRYYSELSF